MVLLHHQSCPSHRQLRQADFRKIVQPLSITMAVTAACHLLLMSPCLSPASSPPSSSCTSHVCAQFCSSYTTALCPMCPMTLQQPWRRCLSSFQNPEMSAVNSGCRACSHKMSLKVQNSATKCHRMERRCWGGDSRLDDVCLHCAEKTAWILRTLSASLLQPKRVSGL